jgi:signal transduction histidine kinase
LARRQLRRRHGGLGLAIARAIAQQHRGEVTCDDTDAGARFTLELPATDVPVKQGHEVLQQLEPVL